jgi:hypothetical protein
LHKGKGENLKGKGVLHKGRGENLKGRGVLYKGKGENPGNIVWAYFSFEGSSIFFMGIVKGVGLFILSKWKPNEGK